MEKRKIAITQWSFFMEQLISYKFSYHGLVVEPEPYDTTAYRKISNKLWDHDAKVDESTYKFFLKLLWNKRFQELEAELDKLN